MESLDRQLPELTQQIEEDEEEVAEGNQRRHIPFLYILLRSLFFYNSPCISVRKFKYYLFIKGFL